MRHKENIMQEKLQQAINDLKNSPKINIHGKPYTSVASRVEVFRRYFPELSLITEIIYDDEQRIVIKSTISLLDNILAVGHAEELKGVGKINTTSALENCETSSIGRCLASYGIHGGEYASHNEVSHAIEQQSTISQANSEQNSTQQYQQQAQTQNTNELEQLNAVGLSFESQGNETIITGNSYGQQSLLKSLKYRYDPSRKCWWKANSYQQQAA